MAKKRQPSLGGQRSLFGGPPRVQYLRDRWARARERANVAGILFTISPENVEMLFEVQGKRCDVTGVEFCFEEYTSAFVKHPLAPSIDRRDSSGGYTPDNIRLVCAAVNFGLGQWGDQLYLKLARAAVAKADRDSEIKAVGAPIPPFIPLRE